MDGIATAIAQYTTPFLMDLGAIRVVLLVVFAAATYGLINEIASFVNQRVGDGPEPRDRARPA